MQTRTRTLRGGKQQDDFLKACRLGQLEKVQALLAKPRVNPAIQNQLALQDAVIGQHTEIVRLLLADRRIDPALDRQKAFHLACERNASDSIVRVFLAHPRINPTLDDQVGFLHAIMNNRLATVRLFLSDARIDPRHQQQRALLLAAGHSDTPILLCLLQDPRINPSLQTQRAVRYAIEKKKTANVQLLLQDPRIDPSANSQEALKFACVIGNLEIVNLLLADPRVDPSVDNQEPLQIAEDNGHVAIVNRLKADPRVGLVPGSVPKWKGFTRSDIRKFDSVFEATANNYSCCPVCLRYVSREDGCMYMTHNCSTEPGAKTIHKKLYDMYKSPEGNIYWCTICGRICLGHRHYQLGPVLTKAELVPVRPGSDPFATDCSRTEGGGGVHEKAQRFHAFRQYAQMLQEEVGEITHQEAYHQLVESMWVAPLFPATRKLAKKNMEAKRFAIPNTDFPLTPHEEVANVPRPAQNATLLPTIVESGYNAISTLDDEKVIQFHHRQRNGQVHHHAGEGEQIGVESFVNYIQSNLSDGEAGKCWLPSCGADIHPDEIQDLVRKEVFPAILYARYKDAFNRTHQQGGGRADILAEATQAQCVVYQAKRQARKTHQ